MFPKLYRSLWFGVLLAAGWKSHVLAEEPPALEFSINHGQQQLRFEPFPSADSYQVFRTESLDKPFVEDGSGTFSGFTWTAPFRADALGFYTLKPVAMPNNDLLAAIVLNRLAYGQTPDELERVKAMGAEAYIQEQLAPEQIEEDLELDAVTAIPSSAEWKRYTVTGNATTATLYLYLTFMGEGWIDDLALVAGSTPEVGQNLVRNGNFEVPLAPSDWTISENHAGSAIDPTVKHSGNGSLHMVAGSGGTTKASAIWQDLGTIKTGQAYTLSYWFLPSTKKLSSWTVRLSGSDSGTGIYSSPAPPISLRTKLQVDAANIDDLRAWHILRAVQSKKQLLEVLLQFLENHFVTEYSKSGDWFDRFYDNPQRSQEAVNLEYREIQRWRQALLNPKCTFYDLLKISAESPAMIIFLDTVESRGNANNIANENYARELLELFTFGVDNGYDQNDIVETSRAWTGWTVGLLDKTNQFDPFAPRLTDLYPNTPVANLVGVWTLKYRELRHANSAKTIFAGKTVQERFGPPYAGRNYELQLPARSGTSSMQDGYDVIRHLADQPFTQEFISVKLCRLFIHDDFEHGVYDYMAPNLSAEGQLIKRCMAVWEGGNPKGQIRAVLETIFNSELFRGTAAASQKVKTPLEFTVSAIRALRARNGVTFTAETDGNLSTSLNRMGSMKLFDRAEPDGYPEAGPPWISAGTLAERLRWVQSLLTPTSQRTAANRNTDAGATVTDPVALIKVKLPATSWTNAEAVAGYFVSILYPAEGRANLDLYRTSAANFLNTADDGVTPSSLGNLSMTGNPSPYEARVRGMVAMLMTFKRFQDQ
jgi:uncharacterized protein (DUF1800 family)